MKRVEIIANSALAEDIIEGLEHMDGEFYYSQINGVHGVGSSGPRRGDHIWPEENVIFILYLEDDQTDTVASLVGGIKTRFPDTGIKMFVI